MTTSADLPTSELRVQPTWRFILSHPAYFVAFGFGSGLFPRSPGTAGTLVAFPIYWLLAPLVTDGQFILILTVVFAVGIWMGGGFTMSKKRNRENASSCQKNPAGVKISTSKNATISSHTMPP